jgi:Hint domain
MANLVKIFLGDTNVNSKDNLANGANIFDDVSINTVHQRQNGDNNINSLVIDLTGKDANNVTLSVPTSNFPFVLTPVGNVWTLTYTGQGGNPSNAEWALALGSVTAGDGSANPGKFTATVDALGNGHTSISNSPHEVVTNPACFMAGTLIATPNGAKQIENLNIGDDIMTTDGRAAPIRWIGRQTISRIFADPIRVLPIRVRADALEENMPSRDLLLSPDHALLIDGALIQAGALVNGTSIVREQNTPQVFVYYHIELADHSLIYAENVPAETFIDNVDRLGFDNWAEHQTLYGDDVAIAEMRYPRAKAARQIPQASRLRLAARGSALYPDYRADVA